MRKKLWVVGLLGLGLVGSLGTAWADDDATSLKEWFTKGDVEGSLKSYYYAQTFEGPNSDSQIWVNGGNLAATTGKLYGVRLGAEFQASLVGSINDDSGVTAGSMDADGAVLSEAFLQYDLYNTRFKGGRQHYVSPLIANSGSRMIKESFEMYFLRNTDLPATEIMAGWVDKYQTRTDRSYYADNAFVDYDLNGDGDPGGFYDVGDDGMWFAYVKNNTLKGLEVQGQYANVVDEVQGLYADAKYTFDTIYKPYLGAQVFYTDWDDSTLDSNELFGMTGGATFYGVNLFAGYTTAGGDTGDARVFRGLGQGAYYNYTTTTKTAGAQAFEPGTDAWQVGAGYKYENLSSKLRFTSFDSPADGSDLDEWTINLAYNFSGMLENLSAEVDFSILDYENDQKDSTDLRTRLVYRF